MAFSPSPRLRVLLVPREDVALDSVLGSEGDISGSEAVAQVGEVGGGASFRGAY